jgi:hypothetical protein
MENFYVSVEGDRERKRKDLATGWTTWAQFPAGAMLGFFLFPSAFRPALMPTHPLIQLVNGYRGLSVSETDLSPPSSAEVNNSCSYTSTSQYVFMEWCLIKQRIRFYGVCLVKHRDKFTFTFTFRSMTAITERERSGRGLFVGSM